MSATGYNYKQDYDSRFNEQSRDERTNPPKEKPKRGNSDLLTQIRTDYKYCLGYWSYNRDQMADDMRYVLNKPWTQDEINKREGRPCLAPDEISQYLKQTTNNYRQNKRDIKVIPRGTGSSDKDADRRSSIIRGIVYQSNGMAAFTSGFEAAVNSAMGFWGVTTKSAGKNGAVEPRIRRIPNQFTVLLDPDARESDFSDQNICFVTDSIRKTAFKQKFPDADKQSFTVEDEKMAPDWLRGENVLIAEYWHRSKGQVTQYITNGVEILDEIPWPGSWIPIVAVVGEEYYEPDAAGQSKRVFMSLTRRMKTPQKMLCFIASQEAEEFAMAPRSPLLLWDGQESVDKKALENLNTIPRAFVRLKRVPGPDGQMVQDLPGGGRLPFEPNAQAYEISREAWRRSIQAAAGITPLPTAAQRQTEKSGIALERIQTQESIGSFHFTDNMDRALEFTGRILNELISKVMDTPRSVTARGPDDKHVSLMVGAQEHEDRIKQQLMQANPQAQPGMQQMGAPQMPTPQQMGDVPADPSEGLDYLITDRGEWDVTISTGPNYQSQREEQSDFVDTLIKEAPALELPPQILMKIVSKAVQMKNLGNFGDEIAEILNPEDQSAQQLQQAQQQIAQMQEEAGKLAQEVEKLKIEKAGRVIDNEYKTQQQSMQNDLKILLALIQAKLGNQEQEQELFTQVEGQRHEADMQKHAQAHELGLQKDQQSHEHQIADKQAATAAMSQASDQVHQQTMAENQPQEAQ